MLPTIQKADTWWQRNGTDYYGDTAFFPGYNVTSNEASSKTDGFETDLHGNVNILLGGAMLSGVLMVVLLMCYCCHKNIRKHRPQEYPRYWQTEPDVHSLEVFTMDTHTARYERSAEVVGGQEEAVEASLSCPTTPGPPPPYDSLIFDLQRLPPSPTEKKSIPGTPEGIIPALVSTLLTSNSACLDNVELNESNENATPRCDQGLPTYEAALKLDGNGYV
ncbi:hypothetical protein KM043_018088 [Ampulex compressa]|nr:hypothetical protein KM043_018088 [Ampulex compressa]